MLTLFGIKNCDTVKRARAFLDERGVEYRFHDLRKDGIDAQSIQRWLNAVGPDRLINRQSATWRQLDEATRNQVDRINPIPVLLSQPTLIKRPVLVSGERILVGFDESTVLGFLSDEHA